MKAKTSRNGEACDMESEKKKCRDRLRETGCKLTTQRMAILEVLLTSGSRLLTTAEIHKDASRLDEKLNHSTVHRNLELLVKLGLVTQVVLNDGVASYEYNRKDHHHHLICLGCRNTVALQHCPLGELEEKVCSQSGFSPVSHRFEVFGYCRDCLSSKQMEITDHGK